jgi:hypothetical protein
MRDVRRIACGLWLVSAAAVAQNLHPNADFNEVDLIVGWSAVRGNLHYMPDDPLGCPLSGYLGAYGDDPYPFPGVLDASGPCVGALPPGTYYVRFDFQGGGTAPGYGEFWVRAFEGPDCTGFDAGALHMSFIDISPWQTYEGSLALPAGGSIRISLGGLSDGGSYFTLDRIAVTRRPVLLLDDFEGGSTCRWSATVDQ